MLHLTRKGDYAIRGMVFLAAKSDQQTASLPEIAAEIDVSQTLLAKILQQFGKCGLVRSYRGKGGGFVLGRSANKITLLDIVEAVEGTISMNRCLMGKGLCDREEFCRIHPIWQEVQDGLKDVLGRVTLKNLISR